MLLSPFENMLANVAHRSTLLIISAAHSELTSCAQPSDAALLTERPCIAFDDVLLT